MLDSVDVEVGYGVVVVVGSIIADFAVIDLGGVVVVVGGGFIVFFPCEWGRNKIHFSMDIPKNVH